MRQRFAMTFFLASLLSSFGPVLADTRGPSAQTFVLECGGETVTVVSPVEPAAAAQVVGTTGVGVLLQVAASDGTVLFEQPSFQAHNSSPVTALTICTVPLNQDTITLVVLMTPQNEHEP
jgi:hypothetical protein